MPLIWWDKIVDDAFPFCNIVSMCASFFSGNLLCVLFFHIYFLVIFRCNFDFNCDTLTIFCYLISLFIFGYIYFISNILYHYNSFIYIHIFCQTLWVCNLLYLYAKWRCCTFVILKLFLIQLVMFLNHYEKANKREFHYLLWQWYSTTFNSTTNHSYHQPLTTS